MRAWTLGVSIVFHFCVISGVIVAPLFATADLPELRRAAPEYIIVFPPTPPAPPVVRRRDATAAQSSSAAPLAAQPEILPETPIASSPVPGPADFGGPGGDPAGGGGVPVDVVADVPLPLPPIPPQAPRQPVRVGGDIRPPQKIRDVAPRYPAIAQASRVEGIVILEAVIGEDGTVQNVRVLKSKPLLDDAAAEAVRQWRFTPTRLNGQAVPVVMTVTVSFSLK